MKKFISIFFLFIFSGCYKKIIKNKIFIFYIMTQNIYIVDVLRSPIGSYLGNLSNTFDL